MIKYPNTITALALLVAAAVAVLLLAPVVHADPAQVAILLGVFVIGIQQVISLRTAEGNGHRLNHVEKIANDAISTATVASSSAEISKARLDDRGNPPNG